MTSTKLSSSLLASLRPLEADLLVAVEAGEVDAAIKMATQIQRLFGEHRSHHRLLRAKLRAFESCLDANRLTYAERGFLGVKSLAQPSTRLYLEASSLLAVCFLRLKKINESKDLIREVMSNINNITSDRTRHQFQKRFVERIEEECIFAELIGAGDEPLDVAEIEAKAIWLIQRSSDKEILSLIGQTVPVASLQLLDSVRTYSIQLLPAPDRKLLPSPAQAESPGSIGKTTFALLRRVAWKTFCKPSSPIYKLWANRIPKVFNEAYFSAAIVATFSELRIGIPLLASGLSALVMKYTAEEFCEIAKPKGLMISRDEK